jgi:molecular chaperone DnaJ/curved DNA-binding protein
MDELLWARPHARPRSHWPSFPFLPDLFDSFHSHRPGGTEPLEALFEQNFTHHHVPKSNPVHALNLELVFSPEEAATGGTFRLSIPVPDVCTVCAGTGRAGFYECHACAGMGTVLRSRSLDVLIPAGTREGAVLPVSLGAFGVRNLYLNVHVRTGAAAAG